MAVSTELRENSVTTGSARTSIAGGQREERSGSQKQGKPDRRAAHGADPRVLEDAEHRLPVAPAVEGIGAVGKAVQVDGPREQDGDSHEQHGGHDRREKPRGARRGRGQEWPR